MAIIFGYFGIVIKDSESARYIVSTLIQSEAAIIAIVISLSLVAVQLAASAYSTRLMDIFKEASSLWILIGAYIFAISYGLVILGLIDDLNISKLENHILVTYFLGIFAFGALIPYIVDVLDLMKPSTVIDKLAEKITIKSLIEAIEGGRVKEKDDPVQPIIDIMHASLMKYDYGTLREGLNAIKDRIIYIFENNNFERDEEVPVMFNVLHRIKKVGIIATNGVDEDSIIEVIVCFQKMGEAAAKHKYEYSAQNASDSINEIGEIVIEKNLKDAIILTTWSLYVIGLAGTEENLDSVARSVIGHLENIGIRALNNRFEVRVAEVLDNIKQLGKIAAENNIESITEIALTAIIDIGIRANERSIALIETQLYAEELNKELIQLKKNK